MGIGFSGCVLGYVCTKLYHIHIIYIFHIQYTIQCSYIYLCRHCSMSCELESRVCDFQPQASFQMQVSEQGLLPSKDCMQPPCAVQTAGGSLEPGLFRNCLCSRAHVQFPLDLFEYPCLVGTQPSQQPHWLKRQNNTAGGYQPMSDSETSPLA